MENSQKLPSLEVAIRDGNMKVNYPNDKDWNTYLWQSPLGNSIVFSQQVISKDTEIPNLWDMAQLTIEENDVKFVLTLGNAMTYSAVGYQFPKPVAERKFRDDYGWLYMDFPYLQFFTTVTTETSSRAYRRISRMDELIILQKVKTENQLRHMAYCAFDDGFVMGFAQTHSAHNLASELETLLIDLVLSLSFDDICWRAMLDPKFRSLDTAIS